VALRDYLLRRAATTALTFVLVMVTNFVIFRLMPGDPTLMYLQGVPPELRAEFEKVMRHQLGLDRPLHEQFLVYIYNCFTFQFGKSFLYMRPVVDIIAERLPTTLLLLLPATAISIFVGMRLGAEAAWRRGSKLDVALLSLSLFFFSMPIYWLGMLMIYAFAGSGWFPPGGVISNEFWDSRFAEAGLHPQNFFEQLAAMFMLDPAGAIVDIVWHLVLPVATLVLYTFGGYFLLMRNTMLDVLTQDYITTARAIGHDDATVIHRHARRNAMLPMITVIILAFAGVFSGAILTETVFSWPGMGRAIYEAVQWRDYPMLESCFFIMALLVVLANFIADVVYGLLDPRIRY